VLHDNKRLSQTAPHFQCFLESISACGVDLPVGRQFNQFSKVALNALLESVKSVGTLEEIQLLCGGEDSAFGCNAKNALIEEPVMVAAKGNAVPDFIT
jgi:hypothetical protein